MEASRGNIFLVSVVVEYYAVSSRQQLTISCGNFFLFYSLNCVLMSMFAHRWRRWNYFPTTSCRGRDSNPRQSESCTTMKDLSKDALPTEQPPQQKKLWNLNLGLNFFQKGSLQVGEKPNPRVNISISDILVVEDW